MRFLDLTTFAPGDLLPTHSPSCAGRAVQVCGWSWFDHLALVAPHPITGDLCVYEAFHRPMWDAITHEFRAGVHASLLHDWLRYQRTSKAKVYRSPLAEPLDEERPAILGETAAQFCRRRIPYDLLGAWLARSLGGRWATRWIVPSREDTGKLYCVEYVGIVDRMCGIVDVENASAWSPSGYVALRASSPMAGRADGPEAVGRQAGA